MWVVPSSQGVLSAKESLSSPRCCHPSPWGKSPAVFVPAFGSVPGPQHGAARTVTMGTTSGRFHDDSRESDFQHHDVIEVACP
jgi:hypothetical protein